MEQEGVHFGVELAIEPVGDTARLGPVGGRARKERRVRLDLFEIFQDRPRFGELYPAAGRVVLQHRRQPGRIERQQAFRRLPESPALQLEGELFLRQRQADLTRPGIEGPVVKHAHGAMLNAFARALKRGLHGAVR